MTEEEMDLTYLRNCLTAVVLKPYPWTEEDKNIGAFRSSKELVEWYGQPPGVENQPYRDRGFYTRELAHLSRVVKPNTIVEFGTAHGIGTCLLRWLNPTSHIVTVDINPTTFMPDGLVNIGHLSKYQNIECGYVHMASWDYARYPVDLCFIDGDHSYNAVRADSKRAWLNKSNDHKWAIVWHDHNDRHPGVMQAVKEFCYNTGVALQSRPDSDTVWVMGDK